MYPARYHRPAGLDEAIGLFAECEDATYLSGGHTLLPTMKQRLAHPSDLIDLCVLPGLRGIGLKNGGRFDRRDDTCMPRWRVSPHRPPMDSGSFRPRRVRSAIAMCAIAAPSAVPSPTTIRLPIIPRPCSAWARPW